MNSIAILDFGSQYAQIIARRVREVQVYCELFPWDAPMEEILSISPQGFILSGGPKSVYEKNAPFIQEFIFKTGLPILGICYGMQALTHALGGQVDPNLGSCAPVPELDLASQPGFGNQQVKRAVAEVERAD